MEPKAGPAPLTSDGTSLGVLRTLPAQAPAPSLCPAALGGASWVCGDPVPGVGRWRGRGAGSPRPLPSGSAQVAGPHPRVPVARQSRRCLETSHKDPRPSSLGSSASGGPAEKVPSQLTRPLKTAPCFCSVHLFLLLTKIRAQFFLLTRLWASARVPTLPSSAEAPRQPGPAGPQTRVLREPGRTPP